MFDALRLWTRHASVGLRSQMQYRTSFLLRSAIDFGVIVSDLAPVWILAAHFGNLDGWSFAELALRPRSLVLQVAAHDFEARKLARVLQGLVALGLACAALALGAAALAWIALGVAGGVLAFAGIVMFGAAVQFWTLGQTSELQNILTYGGSATLTYPVSIYSTWFRRAITFAVPLAFVNYFPAIAASDRTEVEGWPAFVPWLSPLVCAALLALGMAAFSLGLRSYESTGS